MTIAGRGSELAMDCTQRQYELSLRVVRRNLASTDAGRADYDSPAPAASSAQPTPRQGGGGGGGGGGGPSSGGGSSPISICAKLELSGARLRLADGEGPLLSAGLRLFSVELKSRVNGDLEVSLSCGGVELRFHA